MQTISLHLQLTKIVTCFLNGRISDLLSVLPALGAGPGLGCEEHLLAAGGGWGGARHLPRLQPRVQDVQDHGSNHQVEAVHEGAAEFLVFPAANLCFHLRICNEHILNKILIVRM